MTLTLGSLFDGIAGFPVSALRHGIKPIWASEIEPDCIAVTTRHFPDMIHYGSVKDVHGGEVPPVDVLTFGSPCVGLSVAGRQLGLNDPRSALFLDAVRIINEMREATNDEYPKYIIFENVPGAHSTNDGRDFQAVLSQIASSDIPMPRFNKWADAGMVRSERCDIAWRILDAQFWGVAQRRRRIFLVADFRKTSRQEVFSHTQSLFRYYSPGNEAQEETPGNIGQDVAGTDSRSDVSVGQKTAETASGIRHLTGWDIQSERIYSDEGVAPTLSGSDKGGGRHGPGSVLTAAGFNGWKSHTGTIEYAEDRAPCISSSMPPNVLAIQQNERGEIRLNENMGAICANGGSRMSPKVLAIHQNQSGEVRLGEVANTLNTNSNASGRNAPIVCAESKCFGKSDHGGYLEKVMPLCAHSDPFNNVVCEVDEAGKVFGKVSFGQYKEGVNPLCAHPGSGQSFENVALVGHPDVTGTLCASGAGLNRPAGQGNETDLCICVASGHTNAEIMHDKSPTLTCIHDGPPYVVAPETTYRARRLTPKEAERLQGFPDEWTLHRDNGTVISDSSRYRMLGNSVAIPCVDFIMKTILMMENEEVHVSPDYHEEVEFDEVESKAEFDDPLLLYFPSE